MRCFLLASIMAATSAQAKTVEDAQILSVAKAEGAFDPSLVLAVVRVESDGNPNAVNKGHFGLMQLSPDTAKAMGFKGKVKDLYDWKINLRFGIKYLNYQAARYDGSLQKALAAYNAGAVFVCRLGKTCVKGRFTNYEYVDDAMKQYRLIVSRLSTINLAGAH